MLVDIIRVEWLRTIVEIGLLTFVTYYVLTLLRGTRAVQVLIGLIFLWAFSLVAEYLKLYVISTLLDSFWIYFFIAVVVLFQPEFRRVLAQIGQRGLFMGLIREAHSYVDEVIRAACTLSQKRVGALIVIEREASLQRFVEGGVRIDSEVDAKLIQTIFSPYTPLHDGAVIIRNGRLMAAACLLPLSERAGSDLELGTRHRAALEMTEELDAVVVVVSEERGLVSLVVNGEVSVMMDQNELRDRLSRVLHLSVAATYGTEEPASDVA